MKYMDYRNAANRHLLTCNKMLDLLDNNKESKDVKKKLIFDIYYLSGYVIETMLSYCFFKANGYSSNANVEDSEWWRNKTVKEKFFIHNLNEKAIYMSKQWKCDLNGIALVSIKPKNDDISKLYNTWNETYRYVENETLKKLLVDVDNAINIVKTYLCLITNAKDQLIEKYK